jgi:hypothetical protein
MGLVAAWDKGFSATLDKALRYHFREHGSEVGVRNIWQYMRKASAFSEQFSGARQRVLPDGRSNCVFLTAPVKLPAHTFL